VTGHLDGGESTLAAIAVDWSRQSGDNADSVGRQKDG